MVAVLQALFDERDKVLLAVWVRPRPLEDLVCYLRVAWGRVGVVLEYGFLDFFWGDVCEREVSFEVCGNVRGKLVVEGWRSLV